MYEELKERCRACSQGCNYPSECSYFYKPPLRCMRQLLSEAADAIDELLKAAKAMHTWIFLNSVDEQDAYDECGLTDEMNMVLGYGGQFVAEMSKDGDA